MITDIAHPGAPRLQRRRTLLAVLALAASSLAAPGSGVLAQTSLGRPTASFPEDFGSIQTVRELRDGRLLVADPLGEALYLVDMGSGKRTVVGTRGQGPQEYLQPDAVWPLPGDSTLLVDLGNARLVTLGPDLRFGATRPIAQGDFEPGRPLVLALPQGVDGSGNLYFRSLGRGLAGGEPPDSGTVMRLPRGGGAPATVATIKLQGQKTTRSGGPDNQNVSMEALPLTPEDAWGVAADGSLVIARAGDYHVEWVAPDGSVRRGPPVPWNAVRVSGADKEEYLAEMGRSGGGIAVRLEVVDGRPSMSMQRGGPRGERREADQYTWPDRKPAFQPVRISVDPQGRAWVRRHVKAGDPSTYDLFDRSGRPLGTVTLEPGKRVVGFGARAVYVVSFDDFDLAYLERYALPAL
ncbi:MAG: hypothetical protein FIA95_16360 [Gemmatimonadetes bacterium]|nr:hypothetical protein [Gemmatimonadota bacterium]